MKTGMYLEVKEVGVASLPIPLPDKSSSSRLQLQLSSPMITCPIP